MVVVLIASIGLWVGVAVRYATGSITPSADNSVAMAAVIAMLLVAIAVLRSSLSRKEKGRSPWS